MVKEEFWSKAWWFEGHWQKVAMRATVGLVAVILEIREENRAKRASAGIDQGRRKMSAEYTIALVVDLGDVVLNRFQLLVLRGPAV